MKIMRLSISLWLGDYMIWVIVIYLIILMALAKMSSESDRVAKEDYEKFIQSRELHEDYQNNG